MAHRSAGAGRKRLGTAVIATTLVAAGVAAAAAAIGELPRAPTWIVAGAAALAALVAGLGERVTTMLEDKRRRAQEERAAAKHLARYLERIHQDLAAHLQAQPRWAVTTGDGEVALLERVVRQRGSANGQRGVSDAVPKVGLLEQFVQQEKVLVVLGEGGSGKTTSLLRLAADAARRAEQDSAAPIPVYIELRHFRSREDGFQRLSKMVAHAVDPEGAEDSQAHWIGEARSLLYLFDGLNEQGGDSAECVSALQEFARGPHTYIVTSRPTADAERLWRSGRGFVALDLVPFEPEQIHQFLSGIGLSWLWEQMDEVLKDLSRNPFMLTALVQACANRAMEDLPKNIGQLYWTFIDQHIFHGREVDRGLVKYPYIEVKRPLLAWLAERMTEAGQTVTDRDAALKDAVEGRLKEIARDAGQGEILPEPWGPIGFLDEAIDNGILRQTGRTIEFMHPSVQEYFTAWALADQQPDSVVPRVQQLVWRHVDVSGTSPALGLGDDPFAIPLVMLSGLPDDKEMPVDRGGLVERLASRNPLLAARCVGAAGMINPQIRSALQEEWVGLLSRAHERYRWMGVRCLRVSKLADSTVIRRLVDLVVDDPVYSVRSEAAEAVAELGLFDVGSYLAEKIKPFRYDPGTELLIKADPPLAVATLLDRWQDSESEEQRRSIQRALDVMQRPILIAEVERLQRRAEQEGDGDRTGACRALLAELASQERQPTFEELGQRGIEAARVLARRLKARQEAASSELEVATPHELLAALTDSDELLRRAAATHLAAKGTPEMVPTLIEVLPREHDTETATAITRAAYRLGGKEAVTQLLAKVWGPDRQLLLAMNDCWDRASEKTKVPEPLRRELETIGIRVPAGAYVAQDSQGWLIHFGPMRLLAERVEDRLLRVQLVGLRSCYLNAAALVAPDELVRSTLLRALDDDDASVRKTALAALGRAGKWEAVASIRTRLGREQDPDVISKALTALAQIATPEALEILLDMLIRTGNLEEFERVIQTLPASVDIDWLVCERARQVEGSAQGLLLQGLARLREDRARSGRAVQGHPRSQDFLIRTTLTATDDERRRAAATALRWGRGDPGTDLFIGALRAQEPAHGSAAAEALGTLQEQQAVDALRVCLTDDVVEVRVAAAASLCALRADEPAVWTMLIDLMLGNQAEPLRRRATALLATPPAERAIIDRVKADSMAGRYDAVEELATRLLAVGRTDGALGAVLRFYRGKVRQAQGRLDDALTDLSQLSDEVPSSPSFAALAEVLTALGRHADAVAAQRRAVGKDPHNSDLHTNLGWYAFLAGDLDASLNASRQALELDPLSTAAAFNVALVHLARNEESAARRAYAEALAVAASLEPSRRQSAIQGAQHDLDQLRAQRPELGALINDIERLLAAGG